MAATMTAVDVKNLILSSDNCDAPRPNLPDRNVDFTTTTEEPILLPGNWKINISDIHIAGCIKNINTEMIIKVRIHTYFKSSDNPNSGTWTCERTLQPGVYPTFQELFNEIYHLFTNCFVHESVSLKDVLDLTFNKQKNKVEVQKKHVSSTLRCNVVDITLENDLKYVLGFGENEAVSITDNELNELPNVADLFRGVYRIYVMCNVIDPQNVGTGKYGMLRMIPINYKDMVERNVIQYSGPEWYCNVNTVEHRLPPIRLKLLEDVASDQYISLEHGSSVSFTLQLIRYG